MCVHASSNNRSSNKSYDFNLKWKKANNHQNSPYGTTTTQKGRYFPALTHWKPAKKYDSKGLKEHECIGAFHTFLRLLLKALLEDGFGESSEGPANETKKIESELVVASRVKPLNEWIVFLDVIDGSIFHYE